ncbi:MAG TPA: hypothetical protein V6C72_08310, partial [Chroococcales cyanobacterium]
PHFGKIALSDYPPISKGLVAADGESLPLCGINTIVGTARLDLLIAERTGDANLLWAAKQEALAAQEAEQRLQQALQDALAERQGNDNTGPIDFEGKPVHLKQIARRLVTSNIPGSSDLCEIASELGYLSGGMTSQVPIPAPESMAEVEKSARLSECYRAFVNVPAAGTDFYFAGLNKQASLCDRSQFIRADKTRLSSIVRISVKVHDRIRTPFGEIGTMDAAACATPAASYSPGPPAVFVLSTIFGLPAKVSSIHDILRALDNNRQATIQIANGDFGKTPGASLVQYPSQPAASTIAHAVMSWLRTARLRPRIDATAAFFEQPLRETGLTIFDFSASGQVIALYPQMDPFADDCVCDQQSAIGVFDAINDTRQWALVCHNQIDRQGTVSGGIHAGQPMAASAINWYELPIYGGSPEFEQLAGAGSYALSLRLTGDRQNSVTIGSSSVPGAISTTSANFNGQDGEMASVQPRKSFFGGGEAIFMELRADAAADADST